MVHNKRLMARPENRRVVQKPPIMEGFKPFGIPIHELEPVILLFDEFEALRLADYLGLPHKEGARRMKVRVRPSPAFATRSGEPSRQPWWKAKPCSSKAAPIRPKEYWDRCETCWKLVITTDETSACPYCRASTVRRLNPEPPMCRTNGHCICTHCNTRTPHLKGKPCRESRCPGCGRTMLREGEYHHQLYLKKKKEK